MSWSPQQEQALKKIAEWRATPNRKKVYRMFGFAGTGKTTLAKEIAAMIDGKVLFATLTGKASLVLRSKGCWDATTIHSLIYTAEIDTITGEAVFKLNEDSDLRDAKLLIIDEVSMVDSIVGTDLLSFGVDILVIGDPAQLPPVSGEGFFINGEPDIMLTEIHRQALDNPIIRMSIDIREGAGLSMGVYGDSAVFPRRGMPREILREAVLDADQVLCGLNRTRTTYNDRIREIKGLSGHRNPWRPAAGDKLICIKNKREKGLFNGSMWDAMAVAENKNDSKIRVTSLDQERDPIDVLVANEFFLGTEKEMDWKIRRKFEEFTFGWAITCHKSQGSQWDRVLIFDESGAFREHRKNWLYTAVTRAAEQVTVIV